MLLGLDEFAIIAMSAVRGPAAQSVGYDAEAQCQLARAEGALASARSFLFDSIARDLGHGLPWLRA